MIQNLKKHLQCENTEHQDDSIKYYGIFSDVNTGQIPFQLEHFWDLKYASLFEGGLADEYKAVAPYLVALSPSSKYLDEILKIYGQNGCIFFSTKLEFDDVLQHMRECFNIEDDEGNEGWFLFYNPVVLRNLTDEGNPEILQALFSDIINYYCEAEDDPMTLYRYQYHGGAVMRKSFSLQEKSTDTPLT